MIPVPFIVFCLVSLAFTKPVTSNLVTHETRANIPHGFVLNDSAPADAILTLRAALVQNNMAGLAQELYAVSTPSSERYGRHLTKEEVEEFVKPSAESVQMVNQWFEQNNMSAKTISPAGDWLEFTVPVNKANQLLDTKFSTYIHTETGQQVIRTLSYSIPESLKGHLDLIHPTISFAMPLARRPLLTSSLPDLAHSLTVNVTNHTVPASCSSKITPACLQALYNIPTTLATQSSNVLGVSSFIFEHADEADLRLFLKEFRPDLPSDTTFALQSLDNGTNPQDLKDDGEEADLDIQYTVGLASGVPTTFIVVGPTNTSVNQDDGLGGWFDLVSFLLAESNPPTVLTTSYGFSENDISASVGNQLCNALMQLGARGTSVLFASGDGGVSGAQPQDCTTFIPTFPSGCPFVTSVGATSGVSEVAASLSSGGFSDIFPQPAYQSSAVSSYLTSLGSAYSGLYNSTGRAFPDVSAQGNNVEIVFRRIPMLVNGTSCASPIFASVIALLNDELIANDKSPLGFLNPFLYSEAGAAALNDITSGNNPGCNTDGFSASTGWDPISGLGTPNYAKLKAAVGL